MSDEHAALLTALEGWHRWGSWAAHFFVDGKQLCPTGHNRFTNAALAVAPSRPKPAELAPSGLPFGRVCARCCKLARRAKSAR